MTLNTTPIRNQYTINLFILFLFLFVFLSTLGGCKKRVPERIDEEEIISPTTGTRSEFTLDSIYLYAKQVYLWNEALPAYKDFAPRKKYSDISPLDIAFRMELFDISQLKINEVTGKPYELGLQRGTPKYSYLTYGRSSTSGSTGGIANNSAVKAKSIITTKDNIIAYLALESFPSLISSKIQLDEAFEEFETARSNCLVLDLRYNTGGYVETAEYVANLIAPSTINNKVMYAEIFNSTLQSGGAKILRHQPYLDELGKTVIVNGKIATLADVDYSELGNTYRFKKKGGLETIKTIYVIVSEQTASASELLISCLKPYFNVTLVGTQTYGKPVGFFAINIDQYAVYFSSFLIKNAAGWSDYFQGMEPDIPIQQTSTPLLGDPEELCLKACISSINKQTSQKISVKASIVSTSKKQYHTINNLAPLTDFGLLENRLKLKN